VEQQWCTLLQKFIDCSINEWQRRLKCVVQTNGRHMENLLKQRFCCRLHTAFLLQFMHISELYRFIDLSCKLHICTHAVLCGATYHSTVKSINRYIRLFVINCCLCVPKNYYRLGQSILGENVSWPHFWPTRCVSCLEQTQNSYFISTIIHFKINVNESALFCSSMPHLPSLSVNITTTARLKQCDGDISMLL